MKRPLLIAALLAATPLLANKSHAEPLQMFNVTAPAAGVMTFGGTGTASYSQSLGSNNAFNVGSSSNIGVSASASSSQDFDASGSAHLHLDDSSHLLQSTGSATSAFNASTIAESASRSADSTARSRANSSSYGVEYTAEWGASYARDSGWEYKAYGEANESVAGSGDGTSAAGYYKVDAAYGSEGSYQTSSEWEATASRAYTVGKEKVYNQAYEEAFSTNLSAATAETSQTDNQGIITADFSNTETGSAGAALGALTASFEAGATAAANAAHGSTFETSNYDSESEYDAAWEVEYQSAYSAAYSSANSALSRENTSTVEVKGLGSIAVVDTDHGTMFDAQTNMIDGIARDANGTASASAGANLATSSYANQSNATNTSAFIQAFSGGQAAPGDLNITGVSGNSSDGYTIDGTRTITNNVQIAVNGGIVGNEVVVNNASGSTSNGVVTDTMTGGGGTDTLAAANGDNYDPATGDGTNGDEYYDPAMDDGQNGVVAY